MEIQKINEMKIKTNNIDLFIRLGNVFPNVNELQRVINKIPNRTKTILYEILSQNNLDELPDISFCSQYLSKSYFKKLSSFIDLLLINYDIVGVRDYFTIAPESYDVIGKLIDGRFYRKWLRLKESLDLDYNPIEPYNMKITDGSTETTKNDIKINRNNTNTNTSSRTENVINENSSTINGTDTVVKDETDTSLYGFNSSTPVPSDKTSNTSENTNNSEENYNGTSNRTNNDSETGTYTGLTNTDQDKEIKTDRDITRTGNIGNITQQELIERERELVKYQIYDEIFKDLDSVFCIHSY